MATNWQWQLIDNDRNDATKNYQQHKPHEQQHHLPDSKQLMTAKMEQKPMLGLATRSNNCLVGNGDWLMTTATMQQKQKQQQQQPKWQLCFLESKQLTMIDKMEPKTTTTTDHTTE